MYIDCKTQAELDAALTRKGAYIRLVGSAQFRIGGSHRVVARGSAHVVAWESAHVVAWESAHVVAWESAHVVARGSAHVVAWESAHVVAWESAHVVAWESAHVEAWESAHVEAWGHVFVRVLSKFCKIKAAVSAVVMLHAAAKVTGGTKVKAAAPTTAKDWCDFHGVAVKNGIATVYKAVRDNFQSAHRFDYTPGAVPVAPDWDRGAVECGGGLHFSPTPDMAKSFDPGATKFLACPVRLSDIRAPKKTDNYPQKIKAKGCAKPVYEVDIRGKPLAGK